MRSYYELRSRLANILLFISGALMVFAIMGELQWEFDRQHQSYLKVPLHVVRPGPDTRYFLLLAAALASIAACALLFGKHGNWWRLSGTAVGWAFFGLSFHGMYYDLVVNNWWIVFLAAVVAAIHNVIRRVFPQWWEIPTTSSLPA